MLLQKLNNLFAFTALGASNRFKSFQIGVLSVAITGRMYHHVFDVNDNSHSLHWFLYDEQERKANSERFKVPRTWIDNVHVDLETHNPPYIHHRWLFDDIPLQDVAALELCDFTAAGDIAVVIYAANSTTIKPWLVVVSCNRNAQLTFVPIFSQHYEALQYPLLFPHGTPG
jgi:hypothetical protein